MDISIRSATTGDAAAIQAIYAPIVEHTAISIELDPPSVDEMAGRISATLATHPWLVAEHDGAVVGYVYGGPHRSRAGYLKSVDVTAYISDAARGRGVGRRLYAELLSQLAARGFHAAFAGITLPNAASVALHESVGFTSVGIYREVGLKFGRWHDVGWWQRLL